MFRRESGLTLAAIALGFLVTPALADGHAVGDPENGAKTFKKKCSACHTADEGGKAKVGPPLFGVLGRKVASIDGFKYGKSIVALGETGAVWDEAELAEYLIDPKKYLRAKLEDKKAKSKMPLKLKKEQERADVVAYLKGQK